MRITYIHQYFNTPSMSGGGRSYEIGRRLVDAGHEVNMITTSRSETPGSDRKPTWTVTTEAGMNVHWTPILYGNELSYRKRINAFLAFMVRASRKVAELPTDVVFATSTPLTVAIPGMWGAKRNKVPFVFEVRDMWPDVPIALGIIRNRFLISALRWFERMTYRRASHIVALAPGMRADIINKDIPEDKVSVVPNGCDLDLYKSTSNVNVRAQHEWLGSRKLVIYAGAIGMANGVDYLVHLARHVAKLDSSIRFVVFGDGAKRQEVASLARETDILDRTFFMFCPVPRTQLAPWLKAADLHVALMRGPESYLKDAVNNKFFDALAVGKPIANNFTGWQTRIADEADIGLYLDPKDHKAAAHSLVNTLNDNNWLSSASERAALLAHERFNRDLLARDIEKILLRELE